MAALAPKLLPGGAIGVHIRPSGRAARCMVLVSARVGVVVRYAALAVVNRRHTMAVVSPMVAFVVHSAAALALFRALMAFVLMVLVMRPAAVLALFRLAAVGVAAMVAMVLGRAAVLAVASESRLDPANFPNRLDLFGFLLDFRVASGVFHLRFMQPAAAPSMVWLVTFMLGVMPRMVVAVVLTSLHFKGPPIKPA
jgi:hypothetical protein